MSRSHVIRAAGAFLCTCLLATCGPTTPQRQPAPHTPPHPSATTPAEILANIVSNAHNARMDQTPGYERLGMRDGSLVVGDVLDVTSEVDLPDYYVVRLDDRSSGAPVYGVCVSKEGWIIMTATASARAAPRPDLDEVVRRLEARFGPTRAHYAYAYGTIEPGGSPLSPFIKAETPVGRIYVNDRSEIWLETALEPNPRPVSDEQATAAGAALKERYRRGEKLLLKKNVIGVMRKLGEL